MPAWSLSAEQAGDAAGDRPGRPGSPASGPGAAPPGRACGWRSWTAASRPAIPLRGRGPAAVTIGDPDKDEVLEDEEGDLCGHGTACAGIVRSIAPECELVSVRVLGAGYTGSGPVLMAGLEWAVDEGLQRDQHEPVDHQAPVLGVPARAGRRGLLQRHHDRRLGPQHAGGELSRGGSRRCCRWAATTGPARSPTSTTPTRRWSSSRRGIDLDVPWLGGTHPALQRQQLRHAAHDRHLRADPVQASGADAVPAEERAARDRVERRGGRER